MLDGKLGGVIGNVEPGKREKRVHSKLVTTSGTVKHHIY